MTITVEKDPGHDLPEIKQFTMKTYDEKVKDDAINHDYFDF